MGSQFNHAFSIHRAATGASRLGSPLTADSAAKCEATFCLPSQAGVAKRTACFRRDSGDSREATPWCLGRQRVAKRLSLPAEQSGRVASRFATAEATGFWLFSKKGLFSKWGPISKKGPFYRDFFENGALFRKIALFFEFFKNFENLEKRFILKTSNVSGIFDFVKNLRAVCPIFSHFWPQKLATAPTFHWKVNFRARARLKFVASLCFSKTKNFWKNSPKMVTRPWDFSKFLISWKIPSTLAEIFEKQLEKVASQKVTEFLPKPFL